MSLVIDATALNGLTFGVTVAFTIAAGESVSAVWSARAEFLAVVSAHNARARRTARLARVVARLVIVDVVRGRVLTVDRVL